MPMLIRIMANRNRLRRCEQAPNRKPARALPCTAVARPVPYRFFRRIIQRSRTGTDEGEVIKAPAHRHTSLNMNDVVHSRLACGLEYAVTTLPRRHIAAIQFRVMAGACSDPADRLGLARLVEETLDKETERFTGRALSDAFDAIGASRRSGAGRETSTFTCTVLPEHFERAVELHAELFRRPQFPQSAVDVHINLARQELVALEDDAQAVVDRIISREAYGPIVGRLPLGDAASLERMTRDDLVTFWRRHYRNENMVAVVSGPLEATRVAEVLERHFAGFGGANGQGKTTHPIQFTPGMHHHSKELEQEQIGICWPGVDATHRDFPTQLIMLSILSGGMSARLFTEVREKQGLVYWVSAWQENPRGAGMIFLGASTTPERCDQTYRTLLREVDRLAEDIEQDEHDRAIRSILAQRQTRGESTRAKCTELSDDLFHFGRPIPEEEKIDKIRSVTMDDVRRYLATYRRDRRCVVTLGPRPLGDGG